MQPLRLILIVIVSLFDVAAVIYFIYAMAQHYQTLMLVLIVFLQFVCGSVLLLLVSSYTRRLKEELPAGNYR